MQCNDLLGLQREKLTVKKYESDSDGHCVIGE